MPDEHAAAATVDNEIISVIVHSLNRSEDGFTLDDRKKTLDIGDTVQRLIDQLAKIYAGKTGKSHGRFEEDTNNYPVSKFLEAYCVKNEIDFVQSTRQMAENLMKSAKTTASTGGHVFFAHFKRINDLSEYLIVAILNDELGAALSKTKDVVDALHLDIKGFRLAGRINITAWQAGSDKYLSFIKGRGQDKVSEFFKLFLGCNNSVAAILETQKLRTALESFAAEQDLDEAQREELFQNAYSVCKRYADTDTEFELEPFANEVWPGEPATLTDYIESSGLDISDGFIPDKRSLRGFVKFSGSTKNWRIVFDRAALTNSEIEFDPETESLTIKKLPGDLLTRLRAEVTQDGEED